MKKTNKPIKKAINKSVSNKNKERKVPEDSNKSGIYPLGDRVLVKPFEVEEMNTTASGIIIPDTVSKEKPEQGTVVAIGKKVESNLQVGDRVFFSRYGFDEIKIAGTEYYILKEENVLAVIR